MLDIYGKGNKLTPQSTTSMKVLTEFFTKMANAVLDGDSGKLLDYRHLMNHPKYKAI